MTHIIGSTIVIEPEPDRKCELCGAVAECRPYGPNGEQICVECGNKDCAATERAMAKRFGAVFDSAKARPTPNYARCAECSWVGDVGPRGVCRDCGSRQIRALPLPEGERGDLAFRLAAELFSISVAGLQAPMDDLIEGMIRRVALEKARALALFALGEGPDQDAETDETTCENCGGPRNSMIVGRPLPVCATCRMERAEVAMNDAAPPPDEQLAAADCEDVDAVLAAAPCDACGRPSQGGLLCPSCREKSETPGRSSARGDL